MIHKLLTKCSPTLILIFLFGIAFGFIISLMWSYDPNENNEKSKDVTATTTSTVTSLPRQILKNNTLELFDKVRILCWVMIEPRFHSTKGQDILSTWGKRCNKLLFMSSENDLSLENTIGLPVLNDPDNYWNKTQEALKYIYQHHQNDADWFYKVDDETFAIVENIRALVYPYATSEPIYFGGNFKVPERVSHSYLKGGENYILSQESLKRIVVDGLIGQSKECIIEKTEAINTQLKDCLRSVNVTAANSCDSMGRETFLAIIPENEIAIGAQFKKLPYWKHLFYDTIEGFTCCSDYSISFYYMNSEDMYIYDYVIYGLQAYGVKLISNNLPEKYSLNTEETKLNKTN